MQNPASALSVAVLVGTLLYAASGKGIAFLMGCAFVFTLYAFAYLFAKMDHHLAAANREMDEAWRNYIRHATAVERPRPISESPGLAVSKRG